MRAAPVCILRTRRRTRSGQFRYAFEIAVEVRRGRSRAWHMTRDVGFRGVFIHAETLPPLGHLLELAFVLPNGERIESHGMVVHLVKEQKPSLAPILENGRILVNTPESIVIGIPGNSFQIDQAERKDNRAVIEAAVASVLGTTVRISFRLLAEPAPQKQQKPAKKKEARSAADDPLVQDALKIFGGEVIEQDDPGSE